MNCSYGWWLRGVMCNWYTQGCKSSIRFVLKVICKLIYIIFLMLLHTAEIILELILYYCCHYTLNMQSCKAGEK